MNKSSLSDLAWIIILKAEKEPEHIIILFGLTCSTHCSPTIVTVNCSVHRQLIGQLQTN